MVLYLFLDKVSLSDYIEILSYVFLAYLPHIISRTKMYLRILNELVEPVDVVKPTRVYVLCTFLTAVAPMINDLDIARSMFFMAIVKAMLSLVLCSYLTRRTLIMRRKV